MILLTSRPETLKLSLAELRDKGLKARRGIGILVPTVEARLRTANRKRNRPELSDVMLALLVLLEYDVDNRIHALEREDLWLITDEARELQPPIELSRSVITLLFRNSQCSALSLS